MCHWTAPKCVDRVIREATNSLDNVAHAARTLGPKWKGQGGGLFTSTQICFLLGGMIENERTEAGASYHVAVHGGSFKQGAPVGGGPGCSAGAWALSTAYRVQGELLKGSQW